MENIIEIKDLTKNFGESSVISNLSLDIKKNEFITFLGPSGCGKTTTLRILGGFENASSGDVFFDGEPLLELPPYKRKINTVFQKYALFPNMNVYNNIAYGLKIKKVPKDVIDEKVNDTLKLINLVGYENRKINKLSGGQQQRVAIGRALINAPEVLLLDEPLGALDLKLRKDMQIELKAMQEKLGITFIYVTHDQEEALTMSNRIVILNEGVIQQIGTPEDIYNEPINAFVADFIGESNILKGKMEKDLSVFFSGRDFVCVDKAFPNTSNVDVVIRPEDILITDIESGHITGEVTSCTFKGVHYEMIIQTDFEEYLVHSTSFSEVGDNVGLYFEPDAIHVMKGE